MQILQWKVTLKFLIDMVTETGKINGDTPILVRHIEELSKLQ